ncbi:MAG: DNA mismatch repair endonuclease MutL [Clostridiales bacterium]|nr:DNA mismatch repair endonuclease MutL [Clostridiales bacterium]
MGKIQLLDSNTINKIAAGEVVERPSSVVKELMENAIDAGASAITVEIKDGGTHLIRITDNGSGIVKEQVKTAFLRHATSKITEVEDLERVLTLGFRGEALASIASVSQIEMYTKVKDESAGTYLEINDGNIDKFQDIGCSEGTSISVKNLFYNVPARRKFLKKPAVESGYVADIVNKVALGHPEISFKFINNGTIMLHTSGNNDLKTAVFYVFGKEMVSKMEPLSFQKGIYSVTGLAGKPELSRANRSYENIFINGRYVKSDIISSAIEDAYKTRLMIGKFPVYVLNFNLPADMLDVNVHPAKLEVRFRQEDEVYDFFHQAILECFKDKVLIPQADWQSKPSADVKAMMQTGDRSISLQERSKEFLGTFSMDSQKEKKEKSPLLMRFAKKEEEDEQVLKSPSSFHRVSQQVEPYISAKEMREREESLFSQESRGEKGKYTQQSLEEEPKKERFFHQYRIVGQIFSTYWIVEQSGSIFMIDQHAAHERILYEELMNRFKEEKIISQKLLQPIMVSLTEAEKQVYEENKEIFQSFGFETESFGQNIALSAVPFILRGPASPVFFTEILDTLRETSMDNLFDTKILTVATMACKAAVKANDRLSLQEAEALIHSLLKLENPFSCPHGRPTIIEMTKYELEKKFKRIQ